MGNWRNRPPRRFFYNQPKSRTSGYNPQVESHPHSSFVEDGVPSWEKKFCYLIGSVPWRKIVDAKKFMYCHGNVLNWDDSACEEAFQNAKNRFWAEINGLSCDISLPDPDTYIDEINWNPDIDPELIKELERELFVPDEGVKDGKVGRRRKKSRNIVSIPSDGCNRNPGDVKNPWECKNTQNSVAVKDKAQGWNQWGNIVNNSSKLNGDDNPWEHSFPQGNEAVKGNTWEDCSNKLGGWNHSGNHVSQLKDWGKSTNPWECNSNMQNSLALKDKAQGWNQWGTNLNNSSNLNCDDNPWERSFSQGNEAVKSNTWEDCGNKSWRWNDSGNLVNQSKDWNKSSNSWECSFQGVCSVKDKGWGNFGDSSWGYNNQQESRKLNNGSNSQKSRFVQGSGTPKDRGWRDSGGNSWGGGKWWDNYSKKPKTMELRKSSGRWGTGNQGCWNREGTHQYITGHKSTRLQEDDYQAGHSWREGETKKRVSFA